MSSPYSKDNNNDNNNVNLFNLFELALRLSREAGELIFKAFSQPKEISTKSSSADIVTQTDKLCEDYIISQIHQFYPNHAIIAEESHQTDGVYNISDIPTWVIDPVDGTNNFAHNLPHAHYTKYTINTQNMFKPNLDFYHQYIEYQPVSIQTSKIKTLDKAAIVTEFGYSREPSQVELNLAKLRTLALNQTQTVRMYGSCAMNMCYVAIGRVEAYYEGYNNFIGPKPWDSAAASLIVSEAGGYLCDPNNSKEKFSIFTGRVLAACNKEIGDSIVKLFEPLVKQHEKQHPNGTIGKSNL